MSAEVLDRGASGVPVRDRVPPILTSSQAGLVILTDAHKAGLPMPRTVEQMHLDDQSEATLVFYVRNMDDLVAWARWIGADVVTDPYVMPDSGRVHCSARGELFGHNVSVVCMFVPAELVHA